MLCSGVLPTQVLKASVHFAENASIYKTKSSKNEFFLLLVMLTSQN